MAGFPADQDVTPGIALPMRARADLQVAAWTVDDPAEMKRLLELKLDAICTDRPDLLQTFEQGR